MTGNENETYDEEAMPLTLVIQYSAFSFLLCFILLYAYHKLSTVVFGSIYNNLPKIKKFDWDTRLVSITHAVIVTPPTLYALTNPRIWVNSLYAVSSLIQLSGCIMAGYMLYDIVFMIFTGLGKPEDFAHHIITLSCLYIGLVNGDLLLYGGSLVGFLEASTPFLHISWFMKETKNEDHILNLINGLTFVVVFFICRCCISPYFAYLLFMELSNDYENSKLLHWLAFSFFVFFCGLNYFWLVKILKIFLKKLSGRNSNTIKND